MGKCSEHILHEYRIKALEEKIATDHETMEGNSRAIDASNAKMDFVLKDVSDLERKADDAESEPKELLAAWKLAVVAAVASLVANAVFSALFER